MFLAVFALCFASLAAVGIAATCTAGILSLEGPASSSFDTYVMGSCFTVYNATTSSYTGLQVNCEGGIAQMSVYASNGCSGLSEGTVSLLSMFPAAVYTCGTCTTYLELRVYDTCSMTGNYVEVSVPLGCQDNLPDFGQSLALSCATTSYFQVRYESLGCSGEAVEVITRNSGECFDGSVAVVVRCTSPSPVPSASTSMSTRVATVYVAVISLLVWAMHD